MHRAYSWTKAGGINPNPWKEPQSTVAQLERMHFAVKLDYPHVKYWDLKEQHLTIGEFCKKHHEQVYNQQFMFVVGAYIEKNNLSRFSTYKWRECYCDMSFTTYKWKETKKDALKVCTTEFVFNSH